MKNFFSFILEVFKIAVLALAIVVPIRYFIFQPFIVKGQSMEPNFQQGNYLIIDEISYRFKEPVRGEVVVFRYPYNLSQRYIKRIIGLPGETIEIKNNQIYIFSQDNKKTFLKESYLSEFEFASKDAKLKIGQDEYFVMGDNRPFSSDSRSWGLLPKENIIGRVILRLLPFGEISEFSAPVY